MRICICVLLAAGILVGGGCRTVSPGLITPPEPRRPPEETYRSNLAASIYGNVSVSGSTTQGGTAYNNVDSSNASAEPKTISGSTQGNENEISCGGPEYHFNSESGATAQFHPRINSDLKTYGFSLNLGVRAGGGGWKTRVLVFCGDSFLTDSTARAHARGEVHVNFNAPSGTDQLVIQVSGQDPGPVKVTDLSGNALPLTPLSLGQGQSVVLPAAGEYIVAAELTDQVQAHGSPRVQHEKNIAVTVQSLRDAVSLGYGGTLSENFKIPLPVLISASALQDELKKQLLDSKGRYYPCKTCGAAGGLFIKDPVIDISGGWVVLTVGLGGGLGPLAAFPVNGNLVFYAAPNVSANVVSLDGLLVETQSESFLVQLAQGAGFEQKLVQVIKDKARYDLTAKLAELTRDLRKQFPIKWGSACLDLDLSNLELEDGGVYTLPQTQQIEVRFLISLKTGSFTTCNSRELVHLFLRGEFRPDPPDPP